MGGATHKFHLRKLLCRCSLVFLLVLSACSLEPVAQDVNQKQANEIVSLLNKEGISSFATKGRGGRGMYAVSVKQSAYHQSVSILTEHNLPRDPAPTFDELISQRGFIPNSREVEALRLDRAFAVEIEETLENYPSVTSAKVIVRSQLVKDGQQPTVAVILQAKEELPPDEFSVRRMISGVVPGVQPEQIILKILPAALPRDSAGVVGLSNEEGLVLTVPLTSFLLWRVPEGDLYEIMVVLGGSLLVMGIACFAIGYIFARYRRVNRVRLIGGQGEGRLMTAEGFPEI